MTRFVWIDSEELCEEFCEKTWFHDEDQGFIYDTLKNERVCDFGNGEIYYPTCGTAPDEIYLGIMINALNNHNFEDE